MAGQRLMITALDTTRNVLKRAAICRIDTLAMRNIGLLMLFFEDIPELVVDVVYITKNNGNIPDSASLFFLLSYFRWITASPA